MLLFWPVSGDSVNSVIVVICSAVIISNDNNDTYDVDGERQQTSDRIVKPRVGNTTLRRRLKTVQPLDGCHLPS